VGDRAKRAKYDSGEIDASGNPRGFDPRAHSHEHSPFQRGGAGRDFHFTWTNQGDTAESSRPKTYLRSVQRTWRRPPRRPRAGAQRRRLCHDHHRQLRRSCPRRQPPGGSAEWRRDRRKIPAGLKDGQQIRLKGRGGAGRNSAPAGDILISVSVAPHPWLVRDGNDLRMDLPVTLREAVLGAKVAVPTLTGTVQLTVPANSSSGATLRLKARAFPRPAAGQATSMYDWSWPAGQTRSGAAEVCRTWPAAYDPRANCADRPSTKAEGLLAALPRALVALA